MHDTAPIGLGDRFARFIQAQVELGRYESPSEVLRVGLRLSEERERGTPAALHAALIEGEQSGPATPLDVDAPVASKKSRNQAAE